MKENELLNEAYTVLFESDLINRKKRAIYIENESRDTKELSA